MCVRLVVASSCPSNPVSFSIVKIVAYFLLDALIILSMLAVVGMSGILRSHLYFGRFHSNSLVFTKYWYALAYPVLVLLHTFMLAIAIFTSSGCLKSASWLSRLSLCEMS